MTHEQFWLIIQTILNNTRYNKRIITGLPPVDEMNDQLRYTRALEIIDKVITLHDMSTEAERQEVAFIDDFGMDRTQLRTTLQTHWYTMHADSQ